VYERQLRTDTSISVSPGRGAHYSAGDTVKIFYDPHNPEVIAAPRSVGVGFFYMFIGLSGVALLVFALSAVLKKRRTFLVTEEAYRREKANAKKSKAVRKAGKKR